MHACMSPENLCVNIYLYIFDAIRMQEKGYTKLLIANAMKYFAICMGPMFANQYLRWSEF